MRSKLHPCFSLVIVTYGRDQVLIDTLTYLLEQVRALAPAVELLVVDQTPRHEPAAEAQLDDWHRRGAIRWLRLPEPHLTHAMNVGLVEAHGELVLYTDDDIIPGEGLIAAHLAAYRAHPEADAVVGQILQPGQSPTDIPYTPTGDNLLRYMDFPFNSVRGTWIENAMGGNLSVRRARALAIGGFDENFTPPVASRFETEFAKRLVRNGGRIRFEPNASIRHLQSPSGGTRSKGSHLNSISPRYGVGDYYFALRQGQGWEKWRYVLRRPLREVRTKFHLRRPWWIPVKFFGELRAMAAGFRLAHSAPKLLPGTLKGERSEPND
ncbi:MAG: glycosyltransferase [Chromatiaceae bacterium]